MTTRETTAPVSIDSRFAPLCPLAWRTALWVREVRAVRPVDVTWRFFSLEVVNRKEDVEPDYQDGSGWAGLRTLALVRRQEGNEAVERLYLALGAAQHGRRESIRYAEGVRAALQAANLDPSLVDAALADDTTTNDVLADHEDAGEMWDHVEWALHQPNLFELKRDRGNVRREPVAG